MGRDSNNYNYERARIIRGRISINGRFWYRRTLIDYKMNARTSRLEVRQIRDFVVVKYSHKDYARKQGKVRRETLEGEIIFVRARQYYPTPQRAHNMWMAPMNPTFVRQTKAINVRDLGAFLHAAPDRSGRVGYVNLVKVALAFV